MKKVVTYLRVSTQRQGASGLGLDAQRSAVVAFCEAQGFQIVEEFVEVESGKRNDRPVLRDALAKAKSCKAILVVAKVDRLARNVHFVSGLLESGIEVHFVDMPSANRLTLHILAAVAEEEARAISTRTKAALQAAKARGVALGASNPASRNLCANAASRGAAASILTRRRLRDETNAAVAEQIAQLRDEGFSLREIAVALNEGGHTTATGKPWHPMAVSRALDAA